ncbi:hypothetical protein FB451DRAFT_981648, partial [Mycena latifolia]
GFVRLHEYAYKHNLRIILLNRRDYYGSTKYSNEELTDLRAGRKIFQDRLALQAAQFLVCLIEHENIPKAASDHIAGGLILMGWSFGNATTLVMFADPATIPKSSCETTKLYLRSRLVVYDPPFLALGYPYSVLEGVYDPLSDPSCTTPDELYTN